MREHRPITPDEATYRVNENDIEDADTGETQGEMPVIGQPRALQALRMGTTIQGKGYNVFVTGTAGTGRHTAINAVLQAFQQEEARRFDMAYVFNFKRTDSPRVLYFSPGEASNFKKDLHKLVENLKLAVKTRLDSSLYKDQRDDIVGVIEQQENKRLSDFEAQLSTEGFQIVYVQEGEGQATDIAPVFNGNLLSFDQLYKHVNAGDLTEEDWNEYREKYYTYMDEMKKIFSELREARTMMEDELQALQVETARPAITTEIDFLRKTYPDKEIAEYLDELEADLTDNLYLFITDKQLKDDAGNPQFIRYGVNVVNDCTFEKGFPIVFEHHPRYINLFGNIDIRGERGRENRTNFMMIQAGSIVRASGGFLIIHAVDLLREPDSWYHVKRTLQTGKVEIQHQQGIFMKPEPIEVDVKIILIGNEGMYDALYNQDPDFKKLFKLHAPFSDVMDRTDESIARYVGFIRKRVKEENLRNMDPSGLSACIEYGVRLAKDKEKISTRFSEIADCLRESDYWAGIAGRPTIERDAVERAQKEKAYLSNRPEEMIDEMIFQGNVLVHVAGRVVGRVNGLVMYNRGYYAFSRPAVILARVAPGERGVVNIEREAGLSGEIQNKGIPILEGFIRSTYVENMPLSLHGSICFEQSYGEIDGDSASSTEIYALLSALANVPLRQDLAVTGSFNQMGQIQPVGGITEKVEGFYRVCRALGVSNAQGVIIPRQNVRNLVLSNEVCEAIASGSFNVYPIETIDDGIELLTGMEAGKKQTDGFEENTFNRLVEERLTEIAEQVRKFHHV